MTGAFEFFKNVVKLVDTTEELASDVQALQGEIRALESRTTRLEAYLEAAAGLRSRPAIFSAFGAIQSEDSEHD